MKWRPFRSESRTRRRLDAEFAEYWAEARARGRTDEEIRRVLGDVEAAQWLAMRSAPPVGVLGGALGSAAGRGALALVSLASLLYLIAGVRIGTFPGTRGETASAFQSALAELRDRKGVRERSLSARLLEPIVFGAVVDPSSLTGSATWRAQP